MEQRRRRIHQLVEEVVHEQVTKEKKKTDCNFRKDKESMFEANLDGITHT